MCYSLNGNGASKVYRVLSNYNFGSPIQIKLSSALTLIASLSKTNGMRYRYFSHITCICYIHFKVEIILAVSLPKDSYRNGRNTASLHFLKSETSRDIKKLF